MPFEQRGLLGSAESTNMYRVPSLAIQPIHPIPSPEPHQGPRATLNHTAASFHSVQRSVVPLPIHTTSDQSV